MPQEAAQVSDKHREKEASRDDDPNLLTASYSLVAKAVPCKLRSTKTAAKHALDSEWAKVRAADDGMVTLREYWDVQQETEATLPIIGVHAHVGALFGSCVETHSELDGSKRKHKGRVAFGGHRIHDGYNLTDEILLPLSLGALRQGILLRGCRMEQSDAP